MNFSISASKCLISATKPEIAKTFWNDYGIGYWIDTSTKYCKFLLFQLCYCSTTIPYYKSFHAQHYSPYSACPRPEVYKSACDNMSCRRRITIVEHVARRCRCRRFVKVKHETCCKYKENEYLFNGMVWVITLLNDWYKAGDVWKLVLS